MNSTRTLNTFRVGEFAGMVILATWNCGYRKSDLQPYGFWKFTSGVRTEPGVAKVGENIVNFVEKTPTDLSAFVPPKSEMERKIEAAVAAAKEPAKKSVRKTAKTAAKAEAPVRKFRVCDEARTLRDVLLKVGVDRKVIEKTLEEQFPLVEEKKQEDVLDF